MEKVKSNIYQKQKSSNLQQILFLWQLPVLFRGYRKNFSENDLYYTLKEHQSQHLGDKLEKAWLAEVANSGNNASLWKALMKVFGLEFAFYGIMLLPLELLRYSKIFCVWKILADYVAVDDNNSRKDVYMYTFFIILALFIQLLVIHNYWFRMEHLGKKVRIACTTLIYRKCLSLSQEALLETTFGQIINLVATDAAKFNTGFIRYVHYLWLCPIIVIICFGSLYSMFGFTATIGMVIPIVFLFIQLFLGKKISTYRFKMSQKTDQRIRLLTEAIEGIKILKMLTWEKPFKQFINAYRKSEMRKLVLSLYPFAINIASSLCLKQVAVFLCVLTYILTGHSLQSTYIFVLIIFYEMLKVVVVLFFAWGAVFTGEIIASVKRINTFLKISEISVSEQTDTIGITLQEISTEKFLNGISFTIEADQKIAVIGSVGCGKSTLLKVLLQEIPIERGVIEVGGVISYASQEPWIFEGTVKDNILFRETFNKTKYDEVVKVCALERDFSFLSDGDMTVIGSKGAILSGGQKSRINLARAVYKDADYYLLDDPLSSVDVQVGEFIFQNCFNKYLKNKGIIFITHQLQYLNEVDFIYCMENGSIIDSGTYKDLKTKDYFALIQTETIEPEFKKTCEELLEEDVFENFEPVRGQKENVRMKKLSYKVYFKYFKAGSMGVTLFTIVSFTLVQLASCGTDYFLSFWVNLQQSEKKIPNYYLFIYIFLTIALIVFAYMSGFALTRVCSTASKTLHNKMLQQIINAPISFFNSNPSGRIVNRFSSDIGDIDRRLPQILANVTTIVSTSIGFLTLIMIVKFWSFIPTLALISIFFFCRKVYLKTSRVFKRTEAKARSPLVSHLTTTLQGLVTIRGAGAVEYQKRVFESYQDLQTASGYMFLACESAFGFWLDFCSFVYFVVVIVNIVYFSAESRDGDIGLSIISALNLMGMMQYGMKQCAELENQMVSVERVLEYTEIDTEQDDTKLNIIWPTNGKIEFQNVSLRYGEDLHFSLKQVAFVINPNEKIGIVGRTGAGKSSLTSVLFRLFKFEGNIFIDDTNIKTIPLHILRSKIGIIPQDPVLFSCSVRTNLDPFEEYQDSQIWDALEEVEMKSTIAALPSGLSCKVTEGGLNFSVGQRQLLCLARAILKMNKIIILDEATANVDLKTDELIRNTIRKKFKDCTVLTIAHRLHSIMDSDKVLVMGEGSVLEFGVPSKLMQDTKGTFYSLVHMEKTDTFT